MKLMVPTTMCQAIMARNVAFGLEQFKVGEIIEMPYGTAITLKAMGGVKALVEENAKHVEAQEALKVYGADAWFPHAQQTISRVADYLASVEGPQPKAH